MASVIARIRRAKEREPAERAQDCQYANGEKLFSSSSSAECTEVEYATEQYSESLPPVSTKTDKGVPALRKRGRDCTSHTSGARYFQRRSPNCLQIYLSPGNSTPERPQLYAPVASPAPACSQHQDPSRCREPCHVRRKRSGTSGSSFPCP
jgi:hypothetical protein